MTGTAGSDWTEEQIAALIDKSIEDAGEIERLNQIVEDDPRAAALAEDLRNLCRLSREAFDVPLHEPTPAPIEAAIFGEPGKVATFRGAKRQTRRLLEGPVRLAAAAAVALAIGVSAGALWLGGAPIGSDVANLGVAPKDGHLHAVLETLPSGQVSENGVQPMLSFLDGQGRPCREFEVFGSLPNELEFGVACRSDDASWEVEMLVAAPMTPIGSEGYAPASGPAARALDSLLDALGAGEPLSPAQEQAWIDRSWRSGAGLVE
ncbi:MAG: hypothetical protein AAFW88_06770 [Pseudomonadota bacterium]